MKRFGLFLFGVLAFQLTFSQENYVSGYVIRKNADTLHGFINYQNWKYNPDKIEFKTSLDSKPATYSPTDIIEFNTSNEIYV